MGNIILTQSGKEKIEKELEYLKGVKRVEIKEALKVARAQGDLSENADYSAAKDDQSINETKILELESQLKNSVVVDSDEDSDVFDLNKSALVKFYDFDEVFEVKLVSSVESNAEKMNISVDSPLGQALYKLPVGKKVMYSSPDGDNEIEIMEILK